MMGRNHRRRMIVCSCVQPAEKKASGSGSVIPKSFCMVVPDHLKFPDARTEELVFLLTLTVDEQRPARDFDRNRFLPA